MQHSRYSPSSAVMWLNCPGSIKANESMPDIASDYAIEGTVAHELASNYLSHGESYKNKVGKVINDITVTDEMVEAVQHYVDYVLDINGKKFFEQKLSFAEYVKEGYGTADAVVIHDDTIHIVDFKYGMGHKVNAQNNYQLQLYALGAICNLSSFFEVKRVRMHVVQPRIKHYDVSEKPTDDLKIWGNWVKSRYLLTLEPNAPRIPSPEACQWCKFRPYCGELYEHNQQIISAEFHDETAQMPAVASLSDEQIEKIVRHKAQIANWLKAVEDEALKRLKDGEKVGNLKLVKSKGRRQWNDTALEVLKNELGEEMFEKKLISVTKADKLLGKEKVNELTTVSTSFKLK